MGITGLIPFLEKSSQRGNISQFAGCTVAIDTYCWLHKGAFSCADKIVMGQPTDGYVQYCMKFVNMLLANRIKPILVFDGSHLPAKAETEIKRRESREANKKRAAELIKMGQTAEGRSLLKRSVDITHEMALEVIKRCHERNVDCIVAPYEADAQLAYLNISGIADVVITEDSDLTLFGCKKIFFKMDLAGNGLLVEQDRLHLAMKLRPDHFNLELFRYMCILSGCDYLASLPGIGLSKACKFVLRTTDTDITKALMRIGSFLNMKSLIVTKEYIDGFDRALVTFKHQLVYCPLKRKQVRLLPVPPEVTQEQLHHAGDERDEKLAYQLALGNCDPFSLKKIHNWDPDTHVNKTQRSNSWSKNSAPISHSMWSKDFKIHDWKPESMIPKSVWPNTACKVAVLDTRVSKKKMSPLKRSFEDLENDLTDADINRIYGSIKIPKNEMPMERENTPPRSPKKINPFLKRSESIDSNEPVSPCLVTGRRRKYRTLIAFKPTVIDDSAVESKYFAKKEVERDLRAPTIIPETPDWDYPETPESQHKENNGKVNVGAEIEDQEKLCDEYDLGVGTFSSEDIISNVDDILSSKSDGDDNNADGASSNGEVMLCSENNPPVAELDRLLGDDCDDKISSSQTIQRFPSSDDVLQCARSNAHINSMTSRFFKWSNTKNTLTSFKSDPLPASKTYQSSQKSTKPTVKRTQSKKKLSSDSTQQSLLNMYGFNKTVTRHDLN